MRDDGGLDAWVGRVDEKRSDCGGILKAELAEFTNQQMWGAMLS